MTWTLDTSCGYESAKIGAIAARYLQGTLLDLGCGRNKVWPSAVGIDNGSAFGPAAADVVADIDNLALFADASMDAVFSSHALEDFPREQVPAVLAEWARVIKPGGYLVLYLPSANLYPRVGEAGANRVHKWDIYPGDIERILQKTDGGDWTLLESEERGGSNEYSLFVVARREADGQGWREAVWDRNPDGRKRALVIRYGGAIGDLIISASVFPGLQAAGYHVTLNTTPDGKDIVAHDPHIDEFLVQDKDFVPNQELGPYWEGLADRYDLVVNLCESVEGWCLTMPGRLTHRHSDDARRRLYSHINYLESTHDIAGVPHDFSPRFYPTNAERAAALDFKGRAAGPLIAWVLHGSSNHKIYPHVGAVVSWLLKASPCDVAILGDPTSGKELAKLVLQVVIDQGLERHMHRLHDLTGGALSKREALALVQVADCVVGPETGLLNAVCLENMPKVIYLSHSSADNLTKHWIATTTLTPPADRAPCYPCHRMHFDWTFCHRDDATNAALCAATIEPLTVFKAIATALGAVAVQREAAA